MEIENNLPSLPNRNGMYSFIHSFIYQTTHEHLKRQKASKLNTKTRLLNYKPSRLKLQMTLLPKAYFTCENGVLPQTASSLTCSDSPPQLFPSLSALMQIPKLLSWPISSFSLDPKWFANTQIWCHALKILQVTLHWLQVQVQKPHVECENLALQYSHRATLLQHPERCATMQQHYALLVWGLCLCHSIYYAVSNPVVFNLLAR